MAVTADEVQAAVKAAGITKIDHHDCSLCGYMVYYSVADGELWFHSSCGCSSSPPRPCSWQEAADSINMQSREGKWGDVAAKVAAGFGITLEPIKQTA